MVERGRTEQARQNQHLIIGPWTHTLLNLDRQVGEVDFGPQAERSFYDIADAWFSRWLKGESREALDWPPLQLFVMGANTWRGENEWPLKRTRYTSFYLHSEGGLTETPPGVEAPDEYVYDPRDPLMTLYTSGGQQVPLDQRALDGRRDVMVYQTAPLAEPTEVTGPVVAKLWASSSAPDTDFIVKLMDVWPDGFVQELCHGIVRARYRESFDAPTLIEPDRVYEYTIRVNPTSNQFRAGHRIRLDVTSSDFPNYDRNHNTPANQNADATLKKATQTIHHSPVRATRIILPWIAE